ncbi:hypothetical protein [Arvimicrobium flavum]|uniref:hypothetical protein n=1 Tax=Arvimicrobium flavum TaxID=3393320 RepID=UPI00237B3A21|nr:hypothetical protein [Mesorhizobium shangrilense]
MTFLLFSPTLASAEQLALDGVWGNETGCKYAREGMGEDDSFITLKADGLESYGTGCEWVKVFAGKSGAQVAIGLCGYEGESGLGSETFVIARDMGDPAQINIYANSGEVWGEVRKCR